jgi:tetratricopeptide (TPR) repeat protein
MERFKGNWWVVGVSILLVCGLFYTGKIQGFKLSRGEGTKFGLEIKGPEGSPLPSTENSPSIRDVIGTQGDVHVGPKYGLDKDGIREELESLYKKIKKDLENSNNEKSAEEINLLRQQLAGVEAKLADTDKALAERESELAETKKELERERYKNLISQDQLLDAEQKLQAGDSSSAEALFEKVLQEQEQAGASVAFRLGKLAEDRIDYRKALVYFEKAVQLAPENTTYLNDAGFLLHTLGRYDKAIEYYEKALASDLKSFGSDHPNVARLWNNLGGVLQAKGEYDKAIEYYEKALASDLKTFGPDHPNVAIFWNNLGEAWNSKGKYDKAIEYYEKAEASDLKTFGPDHSNVARLWNNLGAAWDSKGEYDKAIEYYEKAEASDLKSFGPDHPNVARLWNNLGAVFYEKKDFAKALQYFVKARKVYEQAGLAHRVKDVDEWIAGTKKDMGSP